MTQTPSISTSLGTKRSNGAGRERVESEAEELVPDDPNCSTMRSSSPAQQGVPVLDRCHKTRRNLSLLSASMMNGSFPDTLCMYSMADDTKLASLLSTELSVVHAGEARGSMKQPKA